jgi:glycosyltransferase involved in cell wall biosynthesis
VNEPLVSICMPLFNTQRFVAQAIESVLAQTHRNLELVICDNCSTDRSFEIAQGFAESDPRVRLIRNRRNLGYGGNLHKVTSLARGQYMMVQCADDFIDRRAVERLLALATARDVDPDHVIAIADTYVVDADGKSIEGMTKEQDAFASVRVPIDRYAPTRAASRTRGKQALAYALPRLKIVGFQGATLYSRKLFESIEGLYSTFSYAPDMLLNFYLLAQDPDVLWLQEPLAFWRIHEANQFAAARAEAIPRQALDMYQLTFLFPPATLAGLGINGRDVVTEFIDTYCIRRALEEVLRGSQVVGFRHLAFALATYPTTALRRPKFYVAAAGTMTGPIGRWLAKLGYALRIWRDERT